MADDYKYYTIENVEALYPKLDTTYKFDQMANNGKGASVKCDALDDNAAYEMSFVMDATKAKALHKAMAVAYKAEKKDGWPDKFPNPLKKQEDGRWVGKARLKGAYGSCLLYTSPSPRDGLLSRMPSSA